MWQAETEKELNHVLRIASGIQTTTYFLDAKYHSFRNKQWSMKGSLDFVFMNQIKQISSRKHED